jgi:hypothetical protein
MIMMAVIYPVGDIIIPESHRLDPPTRNGLDYGLAAERLRDRLLQEIIAAISQNAERVSRD